MHTMTTLAHRMANHATGCHDVLTDTTRLKNMMQHRGLQEVVSSALHGVTGLTDRHGQVLETYGGEIMADSSISRRGLLGAGAAGAAALTLGACRTDNNNGSGGGGGGGGSTLVPPTFVPFEGVTPDKPGTAEGVTRSSTTSPRSRSIGAATR